MTTSTREEYDWRAAPAPTDAEEPFCDLEFREITRAKVDWQFTPDDARVRLKRLYPTF